MVSSVACSIAARCRASASALASAVMSIWLTMKPPSGSGSEWISITRPSGVPRTRVEGTLRSEERPRAMMASLSGPGGSAPAGIISRMMSSSSRPGATAPGAWPASSPARRFVVRIRRSGP